MPPLNDEQVQFRATGIGASEIPAIAGMLPWRTAHDVYLRKRGLVEDDAGSEVARWLGNVVEPALLARYADETGRELTMSGTLRHPEHAWALATPDALVVGQRRGVEAKLVGARVAHHWSPREEDGAPDYVLCQAAWQMLVADLDAVDVVAVVDRDFRIYTVNRNRGLEDRLLAIGRAFWFDHVLPGVPPPIDGSDGARRMLDVLFPRDTGELRPATREAERWAEQLRTARAARKEAEAIEARAENALREIIGEASGVLGDGWKATWKPGKGRTAWAKVAEACKPPPALVARFTSEGSRTFRFTIKEEA